MENVYETRDIYLAAYLLLKKEKLIGKSKGTGIVYFQFNLTPQIERSTIDYYAGSTAVEPTRYIETVRRLRRLVEDTLKSD